MNLGSPTGRPRSYTYIDGGAIRGAIKTFSPYFGGEQVEVQWPRLRNHSERVFYYDALPGQPNAGETEAVFQERLKNMRVKFDSMRELPGFFVNYGVSFRRRRQLEQKRVDTMIAVDILTHAHRGLVPNITLITNDQDFYPVILAAMEVGIRVTLVCQPQKTNDEFMHASDYLNSLNLVKFHGWLPKTLQDKYPLPVGHQNTRVGEYLYKSSELTIGRPGGGFEVRIAGVTNYLCASNASVYEKYLSLMYPSNELVAESIEIINSRCGVQSDI